MLSLLWVLPQVDSFGAQERDTWFPATYEPGTTINLFTQWNAAHLSEGFIISLPSEWELLSATAIRQAYRSVELDAVALPGGQLHLSSTEPVRGAFDLVLQVRTDQNSISQDYRISIASAIKIGTTYIEHQGTFRRGELRPLHGSESGYTLALEKNTPPLHIHPQWLEMLHDSHTLEFWIRTISFNAVVLSAWDGSEMSLYPIELVIDSRGRMRYYRNTGGHHVSLASDSPVADGIWHHVALIHDAETHWTKLLLDGHVSDSLFDPTSTHMGTTYPLALGGHLFSKEGNLVGEVDDLSIWPTARTEKQIRSTMQQTSTSEETIVLDFESPKSFRYFQERNAVTYRTPGGPIFDPPIRGFSGIVLDQGVMLTWENKDPRSEAFLVERSEDGISFEEIALINRSFESAHWSYTDMKAPDRVVFYRLLQQTQGQTPTVVGTIKLGLGVEAIPSEIEILGNYPNPFNPRTSITYEVREPQHLRLSIINLSGHVITVLVDQYHEVGKFEAIWDGTELPSGTYFARLQGLDGTVHTRQLLLTK